MHPIEAFVRNPVKVAVGVLLVALFGFIALLRMPMQLTPEVEIPTISIETRWPGASPQEVEREIIQEQEEYLKSVEGVTKMSSEAKESVGTITLEFAVGTNLEEAVLKVNTNLQQVPVYPEDADQPVIRTSDANSNAIAWFILSVRMTSEEKIREFQDQHPELREELDKIMESRNLGLALLRLRKLYDKHPEIEPILPPDVDVPKMRKFAEDQIEAQFERVEGVSNSNVLGGREPELQVVVNPYKLAARQLTIQDVRRVLREENKDTSGGDVWEGKRKYVVRTLGQFKSPEDVKKQLLAVVGEGEPVYIRDVADDVRESFKKPDGFVRRYGTACIAINAQRETGANVLDVMEGLRETNERLNRSILKDRGLVLTQVYDETEYINSAVGLVDQNIILGGALTVIVLMLFLHLGGGGGGGGMRTLVFAPLIALSALAAVWNPWLFIVTLALILGASIWYARGALVVALAIPTSIIGTFLVLHLLGRSLNVISLAGLSFAVGMLVDNAVVVLENIYRRYEMGENRFVAAVRATKEVWGAVMASTLTTLAVFLPVLFVEQEAGQLFRDIALAISAAVGLSLLVSVTVIPTAAARILHQRDESREAVERRRQRRQSSPATAVVNGVVGLNAWVLGATWRKLVVIGGLVGVSALLASWLMPEVEYLPNGNRNLIICIILPPPGYNVEQLGQLGERVEAELRPFWDIDPESPEAAELDYPVINDFFYVARDRQVFLGLRAADPSRTTEILKLVADKFQRPNPEKEKKQPGFFSPIPGTFVVAFQSSLFSRGLQGGRTVDVEITGPDLRKLVGLGGRILGQVVGGVVPDAQVRPVPSLDLSSPELHVVPKLVQSRDMGVSASELGYMVDALNDGAYAADFYTGGDKIDLVILGAEQYAQRTQDLANLPVATPNGQVVPLSALADVKLSSGPEQVNHRETLRAITIQVTPPENVALETAIADIEQKIITPLRASGQLGDQYTITMSGTADKLNETWVALRWNLVLALLITYLLMAALFESWTYPLVIILSVPLGAVGGVLGLRLLNVYLMAQGQSGQLLDVLTMLGFVILIGTVVNNAILIVHQSLNHMRDEFMQPREAVLESVRSRIRPIFMTTTTTVFGLLPLVLFPGAGSELYRGLGSVVLGGLIVSTIFTLVLVPAMFSLMMDAVSGLRRLMGLEQPAELAFAQTSHGGVAPGDEFVATETGEAEKFPPAPVTTADPFEDTVEANTVNDNDTQEQFVLEDDSRDGNGRTPSDDNGESQPEDATEDSQERTRRTPR